MKTTPPRGGEAFSLVEVTVAIGIFAFVIVGIIGLFPTALKMQARNSKLSDKKGGPAIKVGAY